MKPTRIRLGLGLGVVGVVGLVAAPACEPQVGASYEGEVVFSLEGTVHGADDDMRPRLAFVSNRGEVYFVDGEVTGSFPSKFRFDVTEAPPPEAFDYYEDKLARGYVVMLPKAGPDRLPILERTVGDEVCSDTDASCVRHETTCDPSGSCRQRTLECEPCETIGQRGDPALKESGRPTTVSIMDPGHAYAVISFCESEELSPALRASPRCYHEYIRCAAADLLDGAEVGALQRCSILEESGDTSLIAITEIRTAASNFVVIYATERVITETGIYEPGYNLLEVHMPTPEELLAAPLDCSGPEPVFCFPELPPPRIVDGSDVSIDLGFPPM